MYEKVIQFVLPDLRAYGKRPPKLRHLSFTSFMNEFVFQLDESGIVLYPHLFSVPKFNLLDKLSKIYIPFRLGSYNDYKIIATSEIYTNFVEEESIESMLSTVRDTLDEEQIQSSRILWDDGSFEYLDSFIYDPESDIKHNIAILFIEEEVEVYIHNYWYEERYCNIQLELTDSMKIPSVDEYFYRTDDTIILQSIISKYCTAKRPIYTHMNYSSDFKLGKEILTAVIGVRPRDYLIYYKKQPDFEILEFWLITFIEGTTAKLYLQQKCVNRVWDSPTVLKKFLDFQQTLDCTVKLIEDRFGDLPFDFTLF